MVVLGGGGLFVVGQYLGSYGGPAGGGLFLLSEVPL